MTTTAEYLKSLQNDRDELKQILLDAGQEVEDVTTFTSLIPYVKNLINKSTE